MTAAAPKPPYLPERILVLLPNWLGDVVMCTPALRTLAQRFPQAELTVLGRPVACAILRGLPYIDHVIESPVRAGLFQMLRIAMRHRVQGRDLAVVFPHSFRAALQARLFGAKRILGYARNRRDGLLTDRVEPKRDEAGAAIPVYMTWEYLDLLEPLDVQYDGFGLELAADETWVARIEEHLVGDGPYVGFAPGAAYGPSKRWIPERFAAVADALHERTGAQCVLLTGPGEEETRDRVLAAARHPFVICDEGKPTLDTLKATVSLLDLLVCNDSGPRHVAVAFNVPTVCVMGSTSPAYTDSPYETGEVVRIDVECGPCQQPVCPTGTHDCMKGVTTEMVLHAALKHLARKQMQRL